MIFWHLGAGLVIVRSLFGRNLDYRWAMFGLLAPDLLDKPIGRVLFRRRFQSGRLIGHSLALSLAIAPMVVRRHRQNESREAHGRAATALMAGQLVHIGMDWIWAEPEVALWPFLGGFPAKPVRGSWWRAFIPGVRGGKALEEMLGLAALAWLYRSSTLNRDRADFMRTGRMFD
ncbi:MAG: hypothetical protein DCC49_01070 [Acidobacteria bacterium]|nr:MAG: hypothetical protein DCC49_01070 [Acidobacteriota bacterium]